MVWPLLVECQRVHFGVRVHGRKLAKGPYRLRAVSRNAAGSGPPASTCFKIK
jgi:hypothetical protein